MAAPTIVTLRAGVAFTPAAAASFVRCEADLGRRIDVNSSTRDYNLQLSMYNAWRRYVNSGYKPSLKPPHSLAVHPDASAHSKGIGLDSDDWTRPGFNAFMADHGWIRTAASDPTERHHFEYQATRDNHRTRPAGGNGISLGDDMPITPAEIQAIAEAVWRFTLTNVNGAPEQTEAQARATDLLWATANEGTSIARQKAVTDGLDYIINGAPDSLKAIHAAALAAGGGAPATGGAPIDYDLLASKVADKLAARLVS